MNLDQVNIYMVCVPSGQLGLIQNKLCGQKPLKKAAEERLPVPTAQGGEVSGRWEGRDKGRLH